MDETTSVSLGTRLRQEGAGFLNAIANASEKAYLVLFSLYVVIFFWLKIAFVSDLPEYVDKFHYALLGIVMWGTALYLFFIIAAWKDLWRKNLALILVTGVLLAVTFWFSRIMSTNLYGAVMDVVFCLLACGKEQTLLLH